MFKTYQTKIKNDEIVLYNEKNTTLYEFLEEYTKEFGKIERKLFVDLYVKGKNSNTLKTSYCAKFNITSRQYNSIKNQLDGRVKAFEEKRKYDLRELKEKIKLLERKIEKKEEDKKKKNARLVKMKGDEKTFEKLVRSYRKLKHSLHFSKRKLHRLKEKLEKMEFIKKENYQINKFKILEVEYQDGHSFWHHIEVEGVMNGEPFIIKEVATMVNDKLIIGSSEDPFVDYRNGRMEIEF